MAKDEKDSLADALARMGPEGAAGEAGAIPEATGPGASNAGNADEPADNAAPHAVRAADASVPLPPRPAFAPRQSTRDMLARRQLDVKRTVIPILLTCAGLLIAGGLSKWVGGSNSPLAAWDPRLAAGLAACGFVVLLVGIVNMMQVRAMLQNRDLRGVRRQQPQPRHGV